tara:strand:- start:27 stop:947 length:921 start_codon:yes stop_codon:yes gene_type:complete
MNLTPNTQKHLYGMTNEFNSFADLFKKGNFPNKILLSGQKGIGKCTLAFHLINYILSKDEEFPYNLNNFEINDQNRSYKLVQNKSHPNFTSIDIMPEKKSIDISQIRNLILNLNKSSFNSKPIFILIDNIEFLNLNSANSLLKILEEPRNNVNFILINNNKKILPTIKSRCLEFKISMSNKTALSVIDKLLDAKLFEYINNELLDYYFTPGKIYKLIRFSEEFEINLKKTTLHEFISLIIQESYYKKDNFIRYLIFDLIELYLVDKISLENTNLFNHFFKQIENTKKFNLDEETLFIEFKTNFLNG